MSKTRTDAMELAVAMANMWYELNPESSSAVSGIRHNLYHSIIGDAQYPYEGYASEVIRWLERNIKMKQYRQFKAVQQGLVEFGVIPGPRKERVNEG
ncbi:MAG: hypothetical protein IJ087_01375 [Eggerthellaceae bacterium]|nr:hypothetical protein [Eggerthellaceae bacterium]